LALTSPSSEGPKDLGGDITDRCRWIVTVVRSEEQVEEIRRFLREARDKFRQEVMYLDYHPVRLELVK
jgi:hypothetical protein